MGSRLIGCVCNLPIKKGPKLKRFEVCFNKYDPSSGPCMVKLLIVFIIFDVLDDFVEPVYLLNTFICLVSQQYGILNQKVFFYFYSVVLPDSQIESHPHQGWAVYYTWELSSIMWPIVHWLKDGIVMKHVLYYKCQLSTSVFERWPIVNFTSTCKSILSLSLLSKFLCCCLVDSEKAELCQVGGVKFSHSNVNGSTIVQVEGTKKGRGRPKIILRKVVKNDKSIQEVKKSMTSLLIIHSRAQKFWDQVLVVAQWIYRQMQEVVVGNYRAFIAAAGALLANREDVYSINQHLGYLVIKFFLHINHIFLFLQVFLQVFYSAEFLLHFHL